MMSKKSPVYWQILSACFVVFLAAFGVFAQIDPNPDSPTPILISQKDSLRALAMNAERRGREIPTPATNQAFMPNSKVVIYVTNVDLLEDEDAGAFRLYVQDSKGRKYRFPVLDASPLRGQEWIYALTVELRDELGFWEQPEANGDLLIGVTWRGLASNRLRLGFGRTGGDIKDDAGAILTPLPTAPVRESEEAPGTDAVGYRHSGDRVRFMEQASFGPTPALDEKIRRFGLRVWLGEQFDAPYPTFPYPNIPLMPTTEPATCNGNNTAPDPPDDPATCRRDRYTQYPLQNWFFQEAFYGNAQLRHRTAWSLSQLWVISGVDTQQSSHMTAYHQLLSKNAFGNYRTLMNDMTLNPGMGNYLDMVRNTKNNPNENYAREILQLFSIGLFMLNDNGTLKLDSNNNPIPTYDQTTVNNFTKVFTGWGFCETTGASCPNRTLGAPNYKDPMLLNQNNHNIEAKTLLSYCGVGVQSCSVNSVNQNIAPSLNGNVEIQQALDNIFYHPNVAPFVSRILIQHMVTSDPTPAYVGRVSAVFKNNGAGVRGDLRAVIKAILLDPEARGNTKTDPNYGKLREPVQLATNLLRHFGVRSADGTTQSEGYVWQIISPMGQLAFYSPTVFNYYTPDYIVPGPGLNGPEFAIMTTGTAIARTNFVNTMVYNRVNGGSVNAPLGTSLNLTEMQALAASDTTSNALLDTLNTKMMHGTMTAQNKATMMTAVNALPATDPLGRARAAIYLVATSSQYQVQR
jgi:uncharacterized protein (DUF1800 family)